MLFLIRVYFEVRLNILCLMSARHCKWWRERKGRYYQLIVMKNACFFSPSFSAPTKPENLTSREITGSTIELSWSEPENANGVIVGYRVYYMHSNYTDVKMHIPDKSADSDDPNTKFILENLSEYIYIRVPDVNNIAREIREVRVRLFILSNKKSQ